MIPTWTWPDHNDEPPADNLAGATDAFDVLSDPTRATILGILFDADGPLVYSDLAGAAGIEDNGRLNYHLRQLEDFLDRSEDGYALTDYGRSVVEEMLGAEMLHTND